MSHLLYHHHHHGVVLKTVYYSHKSKLCSLLHIVVSDTLSSVFATPITSFVVGPVAQSV